MRLNTFSIIINLWLNGGPADKRKLKGVDTEIFSFFFLFFNFILFLNFT